MPYGWLDGGKTLLDAEPAFCGGFFAATAVLATRARAAASTAAAASARARPRHGREPTSRRRVPGVRCGPGEDTVTSCGGAMPPSASADGAIRPSDRPPSAKVTTGPPRGAIP